MSHKHRLGADMDDRPEPVKRPEDFGPCTVMFGIVFVYRFPCVLPMFLFREYFE